MRGEVHVLAGEALASPLLHLGAPVAVLAAAALGACLPDLDHPGSLLGRYVPWPAVVRPTRRTGFAAAGRRWFGGRVIWHRGETHSLGAAALAATLALAAALAARQSLAEAAWLALAVLLGYVSHLALDLANPAPQMLLWPWSRRRIRPRRLPTVREGSPAETALEGMVAVASLFAAGWALKPFGQAVLAPLLAVMRHGWEGS